MSDEIHMKPLLGKLVQRAVVLAISDCIAPPEDVAGMQNYDDRKAAVQRDVFNISNEDWAQIDPMALAQNVACRLLGSGGWEVGGVYSGNATMQQVVNACFGGEASKDPNAGILEDLRGMGLDAHPLSGIPGEEPV